MMNFNHLWIFHKVAEKQHFTRAAEELCLSQPAVSQQIKLLEKALKQTLFTRSGQKVYVTEAGKLLYDYTQRIFALAEEAAFALQEIEGLQRGRLAVGASTTIGTYLLPEILARYQQSYPAVQMMIEIGNTQEIVQKVQSYQVEIGLVADSTAPPEIKQRVWLQDALVPIISPQKRELLQEPITLQQLLSAPLPLIMREQGSGTRTALEKALVMFGTRPEQTVIELGSTEAIKRAVAAGLGYAFVSTHTISQEEAADLVMQLSITDFSVQRSFSLVYLKGGRLSKTAQAFIDLLAMES